MKQEDKLGTLEEAIEFDKKRNYQYTAPVAWMTEYATECQHGVTFDERLAKEYGFVIPLYTAPRELSDEEIRDIWFDCYDEDNSIFYFGFARAILKKASEK